MATHQTTSSGPFGGLGGEQWEDDMQNYIIWQIKICAGEVVDSIQVIYAIGTTLQTGQRHGGDGGQLHTVELNFITESLISISGHYGEYGGQVVVRSLALKTNLKEYGPFGTQEGTPFSSEAPNNGRIIGLFGKSGLYLDSIGAKFQSYGTGEQFEPSLST